MANHICNEKSSYADLGHGKHKIDKKCCQSKGNGAVCMDNMLSMSLIENDVCAG